jgi:outer membrane immunogenic protein
MRKVLASAGGGALLFLNTAAFADGYSAPVRYERTFSWTGFYIGAQGGAGLGISEDSLTTNQACIGSVCGSQIPFAPPGMPNALRDSYTISGLHGGGTIGFNWQASPVVVGVEADLSGANLTGDGDCANAFGAVFGVQSSCHTRLTTFGTVTGRLGFAVDRTLIFVKAGGAWGQFDRGVNLVSLAGGLPPTAAASATLSETRSGYTVGTGVEYAFWHGWSAKAEYDFMDFGSSNENFHVTGTLLTPGVVFNVRSDDHEQVHVMRFGLNYKFGGG